MFNQAINTESVRNETLNGTEYIVAPINLLKPMHLNVPPTWDANEAYLPAEQAKESVPSWNGTPLTLNHPAANGSGATANSPEMHENTVLGRVFNADWNGEKVTAEAWFDEKKVRGMGGMAENALERVLNGDTVEVSTGYRASKLPAGEYDGETRNAVQGNLKPDHVAVLPNKQGKCSVEAGCGVGEAVANSMIFTNAMNANFSSGDVVRWDSSGGPAMGIIRETIDEGQLDDEIDGDVTVEAPAALIEIVQETDEGLEPTDTMVGHKTDTDTLSHVDNPPEVVENMDVPEKYVFDNPGEAMEKAQDMGFEEIHSHESDGETMFMPGPTHEDLLDELESDNSKHDMGENAVSRIVEAVKNAVNSSETGGAESPVDTDDTTTDTMSDKTQELVDNHGFDAENLPDEDTDCFEAIYNRFVEAEEEQTDETETAENAVVFDSEEAFEQKVAEIVANRQQESEKEKLASEIAANSAEYEDSEAVLEDYPTVAALNTKQKDVVGGEPDFSGAVGANAQPATNTDDAEDMTIFGSDA